MWLLLDSEQRLDIETQHVDQHSSYSELAINQILFALAFPFIIKIEPFHKLSVFGLKY